jgi:hypothetical protein
MNMTPLAEAFIPIQREQRVRNAWLVGTAEAILRSELMINKWPSSNHHPTPMAFVYHVPRDETFVSFDRAG